MDASSPARPGAASRTLLAALAAVLVVLTAAAAAFAATPAHPPKRTPPIHAPIAFDSGKATTHVRELSVTIGQRVGGTTGEKRAVDYAAAQLRSFGYDVSIQDVPLDNGRTSHNVIARKPNATGPIVVVGGHIDTKAPAPGADDNGTGVGTVLELARDLAAVRSKADLRFVCFGCEELIGDGNSDHHHYGSRRYVALMTSADRARFAAAVIVDMVGYGRDFRVRTMGVGTRTVADRLLATAKDTGAPLAYLRDPGSSGWSDHEPFERAGLPAAWLEWRDDPNAHTSGDTYGRIDAAKVRATGILVERWLWSLTDTDLAALVATR